MRFLSSLYWKRYLRRNTIPWDILDAFPLLSPDQQRQQLSRLLLQQVQYFGRREDALPEWREASRITNPNDLWHLWSSFPILTKETLRSRFAPEQMQKQFLIPGVVGATGGSTGQPTRFLHDTNMTLATATAELYTRLRMGWTPGMPLIRLWGSDADIGRPPGWKLRLHTRLLNEHAVDGYQLNSHTVDRVVEILDRVPEAAIYGFTSMLSFLAHHLVQRNVQLQGKIKAAWNGGEMLLESQSALIEKAFGVPIFNRYGGREIGCLACQFPGQSELSILRPWVFIEIVDEHGKPVQPGEPGRLVVTSTLCKGTPFLRYDVGDMGTYSTSGVDESGIHRLASLEGRYAGVYSLPDGRQVNCLFWNHALKEFPEVREFQVQIGDTQLKLLFCGEGFSEQRSAQLSRMLEGFLNSVPFEIEWVDQIPRTGRAKLVQVVRI